MDLDNAAQSYDSGISCVGGNPCEFDDAFGIAPDGPQQPQNNDEGTRMYDDGGGTNLPLSANQNEVVAENYAMIGDLIENTGPDLTPANMADRAPAMGSMGGGATGQALLQFSPGNYFWQQDDRVVYWDANRSSSYNGMPGSYVTIEGTRFNLGQYPTLTEPPVPAGRS
jgi:hypothetical protein